MPMITTSGGLAELCLDLGDADYVTVDTEFIRDNSYYSRLCLIQVGGPGGAWAIDPLAEGLDLAPFLELLSNPDILKVFHAARQDIEIFLQLTGNIPEPLFDTQVAAMVCGFGDAVSYEKLAASLAGAKLDKSQRFTDWSRRPLTDRQVHYALGDVTHLRKIYETLERSLERNGRRAWLDEEMQVLMSPDTYRPDRREIWRKLKTRSNDPRFLAVVRALAAWREDEAQRRDIPRARVMRDEALMETAAHKPATVDDLRNLRALHRQYRSGKGADSLLATVKAGREVADEDLPRAIRRPSPPAGAGATVKLLKVLLNMKCEQHDVAQKLVASVADLERIAADDGADVAALRGWRRELFGNDALALKHGRLALSVTDRKITLIPVGEGPPDS